MIWPINLMMEIEVRWPIVSEPVTTTSGRLANRQRYHTVVRHQQGASRHMPNLWQPGVSGNPAGRLRGSRNKLSEEVICALLRDFRQHGQKAVARVRRTQPAAYLKILALLVPREHKVEHSNALKNLSDQELEAMVECLKASLEAQAGGHVRVIEGTIEPAAAPTPAPKPKNRLMLEAETAVGRKELQRSWKAPTPSRA
jgi:hypothetical protein